jgi:hypothetical protein
MGRAGELPDDLRGLIHVAAGDSTLATEPGRGNGADAP